MMITKKEGRRRKEGAKEKGWTKAHTERKSTAAKQRTDIDRLPLLRSFSFLEHEPEAEITLPRASNPQLMLMPSPTFTVCPSLSDKQSDGGRVE